MILLIIGIVLAVMAAMWTMIIADGFVIIGFIFLIYLILMIINAIYKHYKGKSLVHTKSNHKMHFKFKNPRIKKSWIEIKSFFHRPKVKKYLKIILIVYVILWILALIGSHVE